MSNRTVPKMKPTTAFISQECAELHLCLSLDLAETTAIRQAASRRIRSSALGGYRPSDSNTGQGHNGRHELERERGSRTQVIAVNR